MNNNDWISATVTSADGTTITFETLGSGAGLIVVGGVLTRIVHETGAAPMVGAA